MNNNNINKSLNKIKLIELEKNQNKQTKLLEELIKQNNNLELKLNKLENIIIKREEAKSKGWIF